MNVKDEKHFFVKVDDKADVDTNLDKTPTQLPPLEDVVLNLAFWLDMVHHYGPEIMRSRLKSIDDGVSEPDSDSK